MTASRSTLGQWRWRAGPRASASGGSRSDCWPDQSWRHCFAQRSGRRGLSRRGDRRGCGGDGGASCVSAAQDTGDVPARWTPRARRVLRGVQRGAAGRQCETWRREGEGRAAGAPVMTSPRACRCNKDCGNGLSQVRVASKAGGRPETEKLESRDRRASGHGTGTKQHRRAKHDSRHPAKARFPIPVPPEEQSLASKRGPDALFVARSQE